jgi:hypothetical protein
MDKLKKSFYRITELAELAGCSVDDAIYYFDEYPLELSISLHNVAISDRSYGWIDGMNWLTARGADHFIPPFDDLYELHLDQIRWLHRSGNCKVDRVFTDRLQCTVKLAKTLLIDQADLFVRKEMAQRFLERIEKSKNAVEDDSPPANISTQSPIPLSALELQASSGGVKLLPASELMRSAANGPVFSMVRSALVSQHLHHWPTIDRDLRDAAKNGLAAAKAGERDWDEAIALEWAQAKGKLRSAEKPADALTQSMHGMVKLPSRKHKLEG